MRFFAFFLALCCGAAIAQQAPMPSASAPPDAPQKPAFVPTLPEAPPGLTDQQARTWNARRNDPATKSIKIMAFDPAVLQSNSLTINQDGKSYVIKGGPAPNTSWVPAQVKGAPPVTPMLIWKGESEDGRSIASVVYDPQAGIVTGTFLLDSERTFSLVGPANAPFWVEIKPLDFGEPASLTRPQSPAAPASSVSAGQK
jgi:hypothetical protein